MNVNSVEALRIGSKANQLLNHKLQNASLQQQLKLTTIVKGNPQMEVLECGILVLYTEACTPLWLAQESMIWEGELKQGKLIHIHWFFYHAAQFFHSE